MCYGSTGEYRLGLGLTLKRAFLLAHYVRHRNFWSTVHNGKMVHEQKRYRHVYRLLLILLLGTSLPAWGAPLPSIFLSALRQAGIPLDAVSLVVQPADASQMALSHNATEAMNPASVMKLLTSLAALDRLGAAYTWKTDVWVEGEIRDRRLTGDLIIKGYGDPSLTLERMWLLQRELRARGINEIRGNLILDTSYFELPALDPGAFDHDPLAIYNAVPAALLANFNATTIKLNPGGDGVVLSPDINLPGLTLRSHLALDNADCGEWKDRVTPSIPDPAQHELVMEGAYARACGEKRMSLNLFEPALTFDNTFRALWAESGGFITGSTQPGIAPADTPPLLRFSSIPLADALRSLNKYSNNLMTRNLFLTLGAEREGAPATLEKSRRAVREWLNEKHIAAPELVLENGAGLSRIERISAQTLSRLLLAAYADPNFSEFESALPILAVDGTLKRRFTDSPLAGHAHLKTGTLKDARALAGYVFNRAGKRMVFIMLVNHANADRAEAAQRVLLEWAYDYRPKPAHKRRGRK
jgi:D-alanyl-D-alanine carboxypeptidase/D-alanyl-D-alanine-endopeptidase (penicillin-binding protein 4)